MRVWEDPTLFVDYDGPMTMAERRSSSRACTTSARPTGWPIRRSQPADNAALYGQCARPHGHNYYLEVTVAGVPDALTGFAVDLERLDRTVTRSLLEQVDHHQLEDAPVLAGVITTGEGLARAFWQTLAGALPAGSCRSVRRAGDGEKPLRVPRRGGG